MLRRSVLPSFILALGFFFLANIPTAHAEFCMSAADIEPLRKGGADISSFKQTILNGTQMYCSSTALQAPPTPSAPTPTLQSGVQDCSLVPGSHPATAADVPLMKAAGISNAQAGMCWNPTDQNVGKDDAEAKQYLRSILCKPDSDNYGGMGPDGTIQGLDAKLAVCAAAFLKTAMQGGQVCVKEGKRSVEKQEEYARRPIVACKYGARCEHPRGIAIDVNVVGQQGCAPYQRLFNLAPQYGLKFYLGCKDAYHFVPTTGNCSAGGTAAGYSGNTPLPSNYFDYPQYYAPGASNQSPLSGLLNGLRGMLGMQPTAQPLQPQPTQQTTQNQTGAQTYYDANGQPYHYNSAGQAISDITGQPITPSQTQSQTTGSTNSNSYQLNSNLPNTNTNTNSSGQPQVNPSDFSATSSGQSGAHGTSDIDFINSLASSLAPNGSGGTKPTTGTSAPANLNTNLQQQQNIQVTQSGTQYSNSGKSGYILPTVLPPEFPQTFGSPNSTGDLTYSTDPKSPFQQVLTRLKGALLTLSAWLTPFGGRAQMRS